MLGIFRFHQGVSDSPSSQLWMSLAGASAAAMLIFILPSAFYVKLVKKEPLVSVQKIGVSEQAAAVVRFTVLWLWGFRGEAGRGVLPCSRRALEAQACTWLCLLCALSTSLGRGHGYVVQ